MADDKMHAVFIIMTFNEKNMDIRARTTANAFVRHPGTEFKVVNERRTVRTNARFTLYCTTQWIRENY
jgi:hypothetical protein